jgi:hypothetical protein
MIEKPNLCSYHPSFTLPVRTLGRLWSHQVLRGFPQVLILTEDHLIAPGIAVQSSTKIYFQAPNTTMTSQFDPETAGNNEEIEQYEPLLRLLEGVDSRV